MNGKRVMPRPASNAVRRIDGMLRRESCGRFARIRQLAAMPDYIPTLRRTVLADAYDAAQAERSLTWCGRRSLDAPCRRSNSSQAIAENR